MRKADGLASAKPARHHPATACRPPEKLRGSGARYRADRHVLHRYLMRSLLLATAIVIAVLSLAIWLTQSIRVLELTIDGGAPLRVFLALLLLALPQFLIVILPVTVLLVIVFVYNRLIMDNELVVMRSLGLGPWGLARPALILAGVATLICFVLTLWAAPAANRQSRDTIQIMRSAYSSLLLREGVFNSVGTGVTVFVQARNAAGELSGILIQDDTSPERPATVLAERGQIVSTEGVPRFIVYNGTRQELDPATGRMSVLEFDRYTFEISAIEQTVGERFLKPDERETGDLWSEPAAADDPRLKANLRAEAHIRLTTPLLALGFGLVALATVLSGPFDRRGQLRRIGTGLGLGLLLQSAALGASGLARLSGIGIPLLYLTPLAAIALGGWILHHTTPERRSGKGRAGGLFARKGAAS
jgi:lipopolysaccharide export system permease protein